MARSKQKPFRQRNRHKKNERKENTRSAKPRILIACEDTKSSKDYFKSFPVTSATVIPIGCGMNTLTLVEEAKNQLAKEDFDFERGDMAWVVMDRDGFEQDNYDNSFPKAKSEQIKIAYANESYELWICLHFSNSSKIRGRKTLLTEAKNHFKKYKLGDYEKNRSDVYEKLKPFQKTAIQNAKALRKEHKSSSSESLHNINPCTNIDELVVTLNKYL